MNQPTPGVTADDPLRFAKASILAKRFGLYPKTFARWARKGSITPHRVNSRVVLYDVKQVEGFITSGSSAKAA